VAESKGAGSPPTTVSSLILVPSLGLDGRRPGRRSGSVHAGAERHGDEAPLAGVPWMASVAAALVAADQLAGEHPLSGEATDILWGAGGRGRPVNAAGYMAILPDRKAVTQHEDGRQVDNYWSSRWIPHRRAGPTFDPLTTMANVLHVPRKPRAYAGLQ
jgi:hypothetical protein